MIENFGAIQTQQAQGTQRVLTYVKNERMGGFVPKYTTIKASDNNIAQNIQDSIIGTQGQDILAYQPSPQTTNSNEQFGFADLIDMVNPLHHIPVIGHVYRELTGDEIKPISRIMGGAAFSGPIGVASALIDTVVTHETGKDITQNAFDIAFGESNQPTTKTPDTPESAIQNAIDTVNDQDMTSTLLAFSDLGVKDTKTLKFEAYQRVEENMKTPTPRDEITRVSFSGKGGLYAL